MWFLLATSLLALSFQRLLALVLLLATCCLAFYDGAVSYTHLDVYKRQSIA